MKELAWLLAQSRAVLLDFDGPVSPIFANGLNAKVADRMRKALTDLDVAMPCDVVSTHDPLVVLWFAYDLGRDQVTARVEDAFRAGELEAAKSAKPTPGAHDAIKACHASERPIVVVSNNDAEAITAYLHAHDLTPYIQSVVGRTYARPDLMKPHPAPVREALAVLQVPAKDAVLIGDSLTDIEVAHATGVRSIGYAKRPERRPGLEEAGANFVIDSMHELAEAFAALSK